MSPALPGPARESVPLNQRGTAWAVADESAERLSRENSDIVVVDAKLSDGRQFAAPHYFVPGS
jgi:hypothetical protein